MFVYKKFKASDAGILAFEAHKEYNVSSANSASLDISFVNTKYSSASLDTYSAGLGDIFNSKRYRQIESLLYKGGPQNYGNLLGGFEYIDQEKRLYGRANILEISQKNTGNGIQKGTFNLNGAYKDDSKGNIYDSTEVTLINGYAQNYPKEKEKCFYLGPTHGHKYTDLNYEIRTGRLIVNAPTTLNKNFTDDSIYLNSIEYVSCSIEYMTGDLSEYTGINLDEGYVKVAHSNNFNFSDEDFTVSFWYKADNTTGIKYLISKGFTKTTAETPINPNLKNSGSLTGRQEVDAGNSYPFAIYAEGSNLYFERSDENTTSRVSATLSTALTHYTFVKDGSTLRAYTNATAGNTATDSTNNCGNEADLFIGNKGGSRSSGSYNIPPAGGEISQILILNKAATADEITNIKTSINGSPFVGNIFYENGLATITKPNIAANTLVSAETVTETLTLATIPNAVDPDYVYEIIANDVYTGELTFFTSSDILDVNINSLAEFNAIPGLTLTDPTFTDNPADGGDFILSTSGSELITTVYVNPIFDEFEFVLKDSAVEVSNSFEGMTYGDDGYTAVGETLDIDGSLLNAIGYPASEGEYGFYHPPQVIESASFVLQGAGLSTSRGYRNNDEDATQTHLSDWFNNTMVEEGWGTSEYTSMLRRLAKTGVNQQGAHPILNSPSDQEGAMKFVANKNTVVGGIPISSDSSENITNATTFRNFKKNTLKYFFSVTGSRGNVASFDGINLKFTSSHDTNEPFISASNTEYDTTQYFPGGLQNGGIDTSGNFTSSIYTHENSHPNIYSGIYKADTTGIYLNPAQTLGGQSGKAVYQAIDTINLNTSFVVAPSGSAGGQIFQWKLVYVSSSENTYWDMYDINGDKCESSINRLQANPDGGDKSFSKSFTINPSNITLTKIDDESSPTFTPFSDKNDYITILVKTERGVEFEGDADYVGTEDGIFILENSSFSVSNQSPSFGPRDVLYLESDYIYPISASQPYSHIFSINGITLDSASLIDDANSNPYVPTYPEPNVYHYERGIIDNISSSFYISKSEGQFFDSYDFVTTPLALRVELVEFDIDPSTPSPVVPDFFQGGRILTSSLYSAGVNVGGDFSTATPTVTGDNGAGSLARDLDFEFEITKSSDETAIAWRMGVVSADNPGDLTDVSDFPLIPVNTGEGFGFSGVHIATYRPTATYSLAPSPSNPNPLTNDQLRAVVTSTASLNGGVIVGNIHKKNDLSISNTSLVLDGTIPTRISDLDLSSGLNPTFVDVHFNSEILVTESLWVVTASYQPALPVKISASFVTDQKGLYEIHGLRSLYFHNPQDELYEDVPIYDNWVQNPENAPQLKYKFYIDEVEEVDLGLTTDFSPNKLRTIYNESADIIGAIGYLPAETSMSIEITLVTGSSEDDALVYPHQGIAIKELEVVGLTSSFQVTKLNGSAFTADEATAISCSVKSPHDDIGEPLFPFDIGTTDVRIVSFSGGGTGRQIMHLDLDFFITESTNMLCELQYRYPYYPIEAKIPFNYEPNTIYSFNLAAGRVQAINSYLDDPVPADAGFGVKIIDQSGDIIPGSPQEFVEGGASFPVDFFGAGKSFDTTFSETGTGHIVFYSSGAHAGDYLDGNVSASYTVEIDRLDFTISKLQGSDTSNENVTFDGDVTPDKIQITSAHVDAGSHGFFTTGQSIYDVVGLIGGNGGKIKINQTLFITESSPATASVDEASGFDYTQTPVIVNSGDLSEDMIGGTFTFTDITGNTIIYTIIDVGDDTITLNSQTVPAEGFDNQILVAPDATPITVTYNQPADNENFSLVFKNNQLIFENEFHCTVDENEYNFTLNPTARKYKTTQRGDLADFATGSNFRPYVTTVGLYNEDNELLVVGKLAQPVKMSNETDTTFVVRYDT